MSKLSVLTYAIIMLLAIALAGISIYCFCTYGNSTFEEIPAWALWFMFGGGR